MNPHRIAIVGAGPVGVEAALAATLQGFDVAVFEAAQVGEHWRRFSWVPLFTPFHLNSSEHGRERLREAGVALPADDAILTAGALLERYLEPLARLPALAGSIHERTRIAAIGREGITKRRGLVAVGDHARVGRPFRLHVEQEGKGARFETADVVIDASGTYGTPGSTGPGGLAALGEDRLGSRIDRHLPELLGAARARYAGRRVLLVGAGHSAATALVAFEALAEAREAATVTWVHRSTQTANGDPFLVVADDSLPERRALVERANRIAREAAWLSRYPGAAIESYETGEDALRARISSEDGSAVELTVDQVLGLVGYRPGTGIASELHVHHCYATEGPMALSSAILASTAAAPDAAGDCLKQTPHGPETLRTPEPGFFVVGAKSYGRNPQFLLTLGHRQIEDVLSLLAADRRAAEAATAG
jgi:thioredoxin reductase